jgi:hypothetical protein
VCHGPVDISKYTIGNWSFEINHNEEHRIWGGGDKGRKRWRHKTKIMNGGREAGRKEKRRVLWYHHAHVSLTQKSF